MDYLSRMEKPPGCALNLALRENVFTSLVCLMNKLPVIIVGMPGCSKSLTIRLLASNLRGLGSREEFFKNLPELQLFPYQGGEEFFMYLRERRKEQERTVFLVLSLMK
jgi:MoxR-like ATPase